MNKKHDITSIQETRRKLKKLLAQLDAATREQTQPQCPPSTWASLVRAPHVQWDWPGWLSRGFLTVVAS